MREVDRCAQVGRCTRVRTFAEVGRCTQVDTVAQVGAFAGVERREVLTKSRKVGHVEVGRCERLTDAHRFADAQVRRFADVDRCAHVGKAAQVRTSPTGGRCEALPDAHRLTDAHRKIGMRRLVASHRLGHVQRLQGARGYRCAQVGRCAQVRRYAGASRCAQASRVAEVGRFAGAQGRRCATCYVVASVEHIIESWSFNQQEARCCSISRRYRGCSNDTVVVSQKSIVIAQATNVVGGSMGRYIAVVQSVKPS